MALTLLSLLALPLLVTATPAATVAAPERKAEQRHISSAKDPAVKITLPRKARYVGGDRWPLYDVADCELHIFVEADRNKRVQRIYWIQFEQYLPSVPDYKYDGYANSPLNKAEQHWGQTFYVRPRFGPTAGPHKAGSDTERMDAIIAKAGYTLPPHMLNVRFVRILDAEQRKEMLLLYSEDMALSGETFEALIDGDKPSKRWEEIAPALVQRAAKRFDVKWR
jgi:hypothetical protein